MGHENRVWAAASEHLLYGWRDIFWNEILTLLIVKSAQPGMGPDEQKTRRSSSASKSWVASDQSEPPHFASY